MNIPSVIHTYILIDIFIWVSNRHLNLHVSETVFLIVPAKYIPLARLTIPIVAQAKNLGVILGSFVFFFFFFNSLNGFIQSIGKSPLQNVCGLLLLLPPHYCHVAQAHHFSQGPLVCPLASVPFPLQSFLNSAE